MGTVTSFSKNTQKAMIDVNEIMADIPASCQRMHFYTEKENRALCHKQDEVYAKYLEITSAMSLYSSQLEALASDEQTDFSENFNAIEENLDDNEKLDDKDAKAVRSLSELIVSSLTKGFRDDRLSYYLYEADDSVQRLLATLSKAVGRNYVFELNTELRQLKSYHNKLALIGKKQEFIAWEMYRSQLYEKEKVLHEKIDLAKRVSSSLDAIAKAHTELMENSDDLSKQELKKYIKDFSKELKPVFKDMKNVYTSHQE
jgi:hypothetical protein